MEALGIPEAVVFAGFQPDVDAYYRLMDVSVLTSLSEGLSLTLLESMSHGLPVVASEFGGNPEIVVDGVTGWLVPPREVGPFARRVIELLEDADVRSTMGANGRRVVEQRFDITETAIAYEQLYESVLGESMSRLGNLR